MSTFHTLSDRQVRLLEAVKEKKADSEGSTSLRQLASKHQVPYSTLQRAVKRPATPQAILKASHGRGRKNRFSEDEEKLVHDAIIEFQANGTPLSKELVCDVIQSFVKSLPKERSSSIGFVNDRPGYGWLRKYMKRFPDLDTAMASDIEHCRAEAMCPENVSTHFARIKALCEKYAIT